jgi:Ricin-type beta-trefoil lectin domain/Caspase domain
MKVNLLRIILLALSAILWSAHRGQAETPSSSDDPLRHGHALLIGISKYDDRHWPALEDVPLQVEELRRGLQAHFDTVDVARDLDSDSVGRRIASFLQKYGGPTSRLFIYYAGHGYTELIPERNELRGFITGTDTPAVDGTANAYDAARPKAISMGQIRALLVDSRAKSIFVLFDSCFAGTIFTDRSRQEQQPLSRDRVAQLIGKPARDIITAGSSSQTVPAHSPIPTFFLAAIGGEADPYKWGVVSTAQILDYLLDRIRDPGLTPQGGRLDDPNFAEGRFLFRVSRLSSPATSTFPSRSTQPNEEQQAAPPIAPPPSGTAPQGPSALPTNEAELICSGQCVFPTHPTGFNHFASHVVSANGGGCLDAPLPAPSGAWYLRQYPCNHVYFHGSQRWSFFPLPSGNYVIHFQEDEAHCLGFTHTVFNRALLELTPCDNNINGQWILNQVDELTAEVKPAAAPDLCMEVVGAVVNAQAPIFVRSCRGASNQHWLFRGIGVWGGHL